MPRIAIRMKQGEVVEVRGINVAQDLESNMTDTAVEELKDLPGGKEYIRRAQDMKRLTFIEKKVTDNPDVDLTSEELRFLYEVDREILGFGYGKDPRIREIRTTRGDKDRPKLLRCELPESIRGQLHSAFAAYKTTAVQLGNHQNQLREGKAVLSSKEFERLFIAKDKEWKTNGVYDYLLEQLIQNDIRYTLIATPNTVVSEAQVVALVEAFGKNQPYLTNVYGNLNRKSYYLDQEWSDSNDDMVHLSFIPHRPDSQLTHKQAKEQVQMLREWQEQCPELQMRVPSLLDAIAYWYGLRAQGDRLDDEYAYEKTCIRHFDPKAKTDLCSYVGHDGGPRLLRPVKGLVYPVRLAVG